VRSRGMYTLLLGVLLLVPWSVGVRDLSQDSRNTSAERHKLLSNRRNWDHEHPLFRVRNVRAVRPATTLRSAYRLSVRSLGLHRRGRDAVSEAVPRPNCGPVETINTSAADGMERAR